MITRDPVYRSTGLMLLLAMVASISGCKKQEVAPKPPDVEVATVEQKDVPIYRYWVGSLDANVNATINAQVSGYLMQQAYTEGKPVKKGDLLFQIDDRTYKAAYDEAEARVVKTEQDVERYTPLAKTQAISQQELDNAIQANIAAKAAAEQARLNYEFCRIISPVDGVAGLAQAKIGDLVGPNTGPLTTVTTMDPMRVYFSVSQRFMTEYMETILAEGKKLRSGEGGLELELILSTGSVYPESGQMKFANNQIDVKTGTIRVVGEFPNPQQLLVPGMFVRVKAQMGVERNALLVPQRAVTEMQGRYLIAVVGADNKVAIKPVQVGEWFEQGWIIQGDVKAGDKVISEGIQKIREGMVVNPIPAGAAPQAKAETKPETK
ncbi:MAG TPA: efflux RND transporter periplasmic adaptor subunit [Candidatus Acidoferrum sp.]|nr:efflux RND transporter periplasmic adaptor subunit [Candidatus Acidoferrum sp.]